jgi:type VI secretion system secreted protein Hcp
MAKKWLVITLIAIIILSITAFLTPALASGRPAPSLSENTPSQSQAIDPAMEVSPVSAAPLVVPVSQPSMVSVDQSDLISGDPKLFLQIEGIEGESLDFDHQHWIDVLAFSWGLSQSGTAGRAGGAGAGRADVQDFSFTHLLDKASPKLMSSCASGKHIPKATLELCHPGETSQPPFYRLIMSDVMVSSVSLSGSGQDSPVENVALNFEKVEWTYWPQNADGSMGSPITGSLDLRTNKVQ